MKKRVPQPLSPFTNTNVVSDIFHTGELTFSALETKMECSGQETLSCKRDIFFGENWEIMYLR